MSDIADYADLVEERKETIAEEPPRSLWDPMHPPTNGRVMTAEGAAPEEVADALYPVKDVQDDGLDWAVPWNEAPEVAADGGEVVAWKGMYDE